VYLGLQLNYSIFKINLPSLEVLFSYLGGKIRTKVEFIYKKRKKERRKKRIIASKYTDELIFYFYC